MDWQKSEAKRVNEGLVASKYFGVTMGLNFGVGFFLASAFRDVKNEQLAGGVSHEEEQTMCQQTHKPKKKQALVSDAAVEISNWQCLKILFQLR